MKPKRAQSANVWWMVAAMLPVVSGCLGATASDRPGLSERLGLDAIKQQSDQFFKADFGTSSGVDPRAREIERRLGYSE